MPSSPGSDDPRKAATPGVTEAPPPAEGQATQPQEAPAVTRPPEAPPPEAGGGRDDGLQAELDRTQDRLRRALADLDNYRKRVARETEQRIEQARDAVVAQWLDVVDSVERALNTTDPGPVHDGLRAFLDQMDAVLTRQGVARIGRPGERFDPERHEAIGVVESAEAEDQSIVEVARSGYARGSHVLRPAQVIVARRPAA
jgi:molecular chaperone GrpE